MASSSPAVRLLALLLLSTLSYYSTAALGKLNYSYALRTLRNSPQPTSVSRAHSVGQYGTPAVLSAAVPAHAVQNTHLQLLVLRIANPPTTLLAFYDSLVATFSIVPFG
jgi:hypothetical protein